MSKSHTTLSIDNDILIMAKARKLNISAILENTLRTELLVWDNDRELISLRIEELKNEINKIREEAKNKEEEIKTQIKVLEDKIKTIKDNEKKFDTESFKIVKEKFKKICIENDFTLSPLTLKTWVYIFRRDAGVYITESTLLNFINEFKQIYINK